MKAIVAVTIFTLFMVPNSKIVYKFNINSKNEWRIVNDGVMGGLSKGFFEVNQKGNGVFNGKVLLDNNGGFTSLRHRKSYNNIGSYQKVILKIKGNGSRFQFRIKSDSKQPHSYIQYFETNGEWQEVDLNLKDFYASWRGRKLDLPNFNAKSIEEMGFLIANYKEEEFRLEIEHIAFK